DRPLGIDSVTGFQALHDEGEGTQASGNGSQLRQAQALIGAETVAARADKGRNRFGAAARAGLAGAGVLVGRVGNGTLRHDVKLTCGAQLQQQWNKGEQKDIRNQNRVYRLSHEYGSFHQVGSNLVMARKRTEAG